MMKHEKSIRIIHLLLMFTVVGQLLTEQFMKVPKPGEQFEAFALFLFSIHQLIGFAVMIIAITYLMVVMDNLVHRNRLFPWLDGTLRASLISEAKRDIPGWFKGNLPPPAQAHLIAGTVHGLGLMLATGMGMTGVIIYLGMKHDGSMGAGIHTIREIHELLGTVMWIFVFGHILMAIMHQIKGHRIMQDMFSSGSK